MCTVSVITHNSTEKHNIQKHTLRQTRIRMTHCHHTVHLSIIKAKMDYLQRGGDEVLLFIGTAVASSQIEQVICLLDLISASSKA